MKLHYTLACLMLFCIGIPASAQLSITRQITSGGSAEEMLRIAYPVQDGGYIAAGTSLSGISGERTLPSRGAEDFWLIRYNQLGLKLWDKVVGGNQSDILTCFQITADGGYILGGVSTSDVSGEKSQDCRDKDVVGIGGDFWVVKLGADGTIQWDKTIGGKLTDSLTSLQQTSDGGYILGGWSASPISAEKEEAPVGKSDYWVVKLSATGEIEWQNTIGGFGFDNLAALQQTSDGGYIIGGSTDSPAGADKTENGYGIVDYWIVKLSSTGDIQWDKTLGGNNEDYLTAMQQTSDNGYILAGYSSSTISGVKTQRNRGITNDTYDYWVVKLNTEQGIEWDKTIGSDYNDILQSVEQSSDGGYLLGGYSNSGIGGEKTEAGKGGYDYWLVRLFDGGRLDMDKTLGGSDNDYMKSVRQISPDYYIAGGYSSSGISGDKTEESRGASDYWVVYIKQEEVMPVQFGSFTASLKGSSVVLDWKSFSEININGYDIQRSANGANFATIGSVQAGIGYVKEAEYTYTDRQPQRGANYYRVVARDKDGSSVYSKTVMIAVAGNAAIVVYPNPVKDVLNIRVSGKVQLALVNQQGDVVLSREINQAGTIAVAHLPAGMYYLKNMATGEKLKVLISR